MVKKFTSNYNPIKKISHNYTRELGERFSHALSKGWAGTARRTAEWEIKSVDEAIGEMQR
jgi:hypothetical protein